MREMMKKRQDDETESSSPASRNMKPNRTFVSQTTILTFLWVFSSEGKLTDWLRHVATHKISDFPFFFWELFSSVNRSPDYTLTRSLLLLWVMRAVTHHHSFITVRTWMNEWSCTGSLTCGDSSAHVSGKQTGEKVTKPGENAFPTAALKCGFTEWRSVVSNRKQRLNKHLSTPKNRKPRDCVVMSWWLWWIPLSYDKMVQFTYCS